MYNYSLLVDGGWSHWTLLTDCSVTCGNGTRYRTRECNRPPTAYGGRKCHGSNNDTQLCVQIPCAGMFFVIRNVSVWLF